VTNCSCEGKDILPCGLCELTASRRRCALAPTRSPSNLKINISNRTYFSPRMEEARRRGDKDNSTSIKNFKKQRVISFKGNYKNDLL
jgi:hypothetical protein